MFPDTRIWEVGLCNVNHARTPPASDVNRPIHDVRQLEVSVFLREAHHAVRHEPTITERDLNCTLWRVRTEDYIHLTGAKSVRVIWPWDIYELWLYVQVLGHDREQNWPNAPRLTRVLRDIHLWRESRFERILPLNSETD